MEIFIYVEDDNIESEVNSVYTCFVSRPEDLLKEMNNQKKDFLTPEIPSSRIIVKKFTKETIEEAIQYYLQRQDGYWLKLHNFDSAVDVSVLNKLEADDIKNSYDLT